MFPSIRRARLAAAFIHERSADYVQLAHLDFLEFREEIIKVSLSLGMLAIGGLFFIGFLSLAIIATAWDSGYRLLAVWGVCGGWGVLSVIAAAWAKASLAGPIPFLHLTRVIIDDLNAVLTQI
ncbi:MAG: hypothetical protein ABSF50_23505 [Burkholderiaceae bacterium]|jgi:uncharacterized membrane protein YqjE